MSTDYSIPTEYIDCGACDGEGTILTCVDDLCRGAGECMHGDGESLCRVCGGTGTVPPWDEDDDDWLFAEWDDDHAD